MMELTSEGEQIRGSILLGRSSGTILVRGRWFFARIERPLGTELIRIDVSPRTIR